MEVEGTGAQHAKPTFLHVGSPPTKRQASVGSVRDGGQGGGLIKPHKMQRLVAIKATWPLPKPTKPHKT